MMPWRERFGLVDIVDKYDSSNCGKYKAGKKFTPMGLMGHLRSKQDSCILHYGIIKFLEDLYGGLRGTVGIKHCTSWEMQSTAGQMPQKRRK